ncbi:hypothetical protein D3C73_891500 [compost metagenome]
MDKFEWHRQLAVGQILTAGIQALAQGLGIQIEQALRVQVQVADDQRVLVTRMPGQRQHHTHITARGGEAPGNVDQRLQQADLVHHLVLAAQLEQPVVQLRLFLTDQPGQCDGSAHIRQRFMGMAMIDAIGGRQAFELEGDPPFFILRPDQPIGTQGIRRANHINQIPAAVAPLPLTGVGVEKVAVQAVAGHLVVEPQGVVARATGAGGRQFGMHPGHEVGLAQTVFGQLPRRDTGDRARCRMRQDVITGLAIEVDRFVYDIEIEVGTQPCHLQRTVATGVDASGFIVVPEDGGHGLFLN